MLLDAFIPIFTLSTLLFIVPILAILILVFLIMKKRKLAFRILIAVPIFVVAGLGLDFWMLQSASIEKKKQREKREQEKQEQLQKDTSKIDKDSAIKS